MAIQLSSDMKEIILFRGFDGLDGGSLYVRPTESGVVIPGTGYELIDFDVVSGANKVKLFSIVRISIPQGYTVDGLNFYDNSSGTGNYFQIELENIPGELEEIGDFTTQQGTYQLNSLDISI